MSSLFWVTQFRQLLKNSSWIFSPLRRNGRWKTLRYVLHVVLNRTDGTSYDTMISVSRTAICCLVYRDDGDGVRRFALIGEWRPVLPQGHDVRRKMDRSLAGGKPKLSLLGDYVWNFAGGFCESVDYATEAIREVEQEVGWRVNPFTVKEIGCTRGGDYFEVQHYPIFMMSVTEPICQQLEPEEGDVTVQWKTWDELTAMVLSGELYNTYALTAMFLYSLHTQTPPAQRTG